jgi:short-subunit dehydrogenase
MNIVISGASKGIGKAIALRFASQGHNIAISGRHADTLSSLRDEINSHYPNVKIIVFKGDMSIKEDVLSFSATILQEWEIVDVLVNNAGTFIPGSIHNESDGTLETLLNTNLMSAYHLTRAILPGMMNRKSGRIFNICSIASLIAYPNGGSYSITKFALLGFSKCLREEMKPYGISVSAILPGATFTDSWSGSNVPEERLMPAEDIAEMIYTVTQLNKRTAVEDIVLRPQLGDL